MDERNGAVVAAIAWMAARALSGCGASLRDAYGYGPFDPSEPGMLLAGIAGALEGAGYVASVDAERGVVSAPTRSCARDGTGPRLEARGYREGWVTLRVVPPPGGSRCVKEEGPSGHAITSRALEGEYVSLAMEMEERLRGADVDAITPARTDAWASSVAPPVETVNPRREAELDGAVLAAGIGLFVGGYLLSVLGSIQVENNCPTTQEVWAIPLAGGLVGAMTTHCVRRTGIFLAGLEPLANIAIAAGATVLQLAGAVLTILSPFVRHVVRGTGAQLSIGPGTLALAW